MSWKQNHFSSFRFVGNFDFFSSLLFLLKRNIVIINTIIIFLLIVIVTQYVDVLNHRMDVECGINGTKIKRKNRRERENDVNMV